MDPALEGGAEISGPETNQGDDDYENRRWQIEAPIYPTRKKHVVEAALAQCCRSFPRSAALCSLLERLGSEEYLGSKIVDPKRCDMSLGVRVCQL